MNFCSSCGKPLIKRIPEGDNRERHVCDHCETIHYQNPRVISGIIPVYDNQILLCRRAIQPRKDLWTLPAGFLENGESSLQGALRECDEEANATVINAELYAVFDIPEINQVYTFYRGDMNEAVYSPSLESTEVELFHERDIPWSELAFPAIELALYHFFNDRRDGSFTIRHDVIRRPWISPRA